MEINFNGRRALVTGAGKGIGRCCAKTLAKCGAKVVALSRTQSDLDSLKQECPEIETICLDLRDWKTTRDAAEGALPIDLLINNAALVVPDGPLLTLTEESFDDKMKVNLKSAINITQVVARNLIERKAIGSMVNVSSIFSTRNLNNDMDSYSMCKAALDAMTRSAAVQFGPHGIRVNSVNPCVTKTKIIMEYIRGGPPEFQKAIDGQIDRIPLGKLPEEQDVVDTIVYLLSDRSKMVNGQCIYVDGGLTVS
ncbi:L-xylulose reductase-like isoform X2 [Tubulanus polymorphus]|uniref:L-xylulose reductase-like isoform X2 n=1 Tax=Tubulanus polymorphus TaxID=672921 RepID=UPI003DA47477